MAKISKIGHDRFRLMVNEGGTIWLDTGDGKGKTIITGDVEFKGKMTKITSTDLQIKDNIIQLNVGEEGPGISSTMQLGSYPYSQVDGGVSGIEIMRGPETLPYPDESDSESYPTDHPPYYKTPNAMLMFIESQTYYDSFTGSDIDGTWVLTYETGALGGLSLRAITNDGMSDISFDMQDTDNLVSIANSKDDKYYEYVTGNNHIPNKQYVDVYVVSGEYTPGLSDTRSPTNRGMADVDKLYKKTDDVGFTGDEASKIQAYGLGDEDHKIEMSIDGDLRSYIDKKGLYVDNVNLFTDTITNTSDDMQLFLTATNKLVEIDNVLVLPNITDTIDIIPKKNQIYAADNTAGKSGIFVTNTAPNGEDIIDELVVKNRSLLFSMLF